jgi:hypothetical protein
MSSLLHKPWRNTDISDGWFKGVFDSPKQLFDRLATDHVWTKIDGCRARFKACERRLLVVARDNLDTLTDSNASTNEAALNHRRNQVRGDEYACRLRFGIKQLLDKFIQDCIC